MYFWTFRARGERRNGIGVYTGDKNDQLKEAICPKDIKPGQTDIAPTA